jgi:hypothetical protein
MDAWEEYFMHLTTASVANDPTWGPRRIDLFVKLLAAIASRVGYRFNVAEMNRIYFPNARGELDEQQTFVRKAVVGLLRGDISLPVEIKAAASTPEAETN